MTYPELAARFYPFSEPLILISVFLAGIVFAIISMPPGKGAPHPFHRYRGALTATVAVCFFSYLAYLFIIYHNRRTMMSDFNVTFDHLWYIVDRLGSGHLAQWNPYSLLGRVAVQWNQYPLNIFTPYFLAAGVNQESYLIFYIFHSVSAVISVYLCCRLLGYGRLLPMLAIVLLLCSGYRYWITMVPYFPFLQFYPMAISVLILCYESKSRVPLALAFAFLAGMAMMGTRVEIIFYSTVLLVIVFICLGFDEIHIKNKRIFPGIILLGIVMMLLVLGSNLWHINVVMESLGDSKRFASSSAIGNLARGSFWGWLFGNITRQPALLLLLLNGLIAFSPVCRRMLLALMAGMKAMLVALTSRRAKGHEGNAALAASDLGAGTAVAILILELFLSLRLVQLFWVKKPLPVLLDSLCSQSLAAPILSEHRHMFTWPCLAALVIVMTGIFLKNRRVAMTDYFKYLTIIFCGWFISSYSWYVWPLHNELHWFFMPPFVAAFIPLGAISLVEKGRGWMLASLFLFHCLGEFGTFFLSDLFSIPWNVPRAALAEVPFQVILIIESFHYILEVVRLLASGLRNQNVRRGLMRIIIAAGSMVIVISSFVALRPILMPMKIGFGKSVNTDATLDSAKTGPCGIPGCLTSFSDPLKGRTVKEEEMRLASADYTYSQDGLGGMVEKISGKFLRLSKSSSGNSLVRYELPDIDPGKYRGISFSCLIKSSNRTPHGIQVDIQDAVSPPSVCSYDNSGKWREISVFKLVAERARKILITFNVRQDATAHADIIPGRICLYTLAGAESISVKNLFRRSADNQPSNSDSGRFALNYIQAFPYDEAQIAASHIENQKPFRDAYLRTMALRSASSWVSRKGQRAHVESDVFRFSPDLCYGIFPAFSGALNTAPVYASEIPALLRVLAGRGQPRSDYLPSFYTPETNPIYIVYKKLTLMRDNLLEMEGRAQDYVSQVGLWPLKAHDEVLRSILAEEGTDVSRVFLTPRVRHVADSRQEYLLLKKNLDAGGSFLEFVTTSDPTYRPAEEEAGGSAIPPGRCRLAIDEPEYKRILANCRSNAHLVVMDLWSRGWRSFVDGHEVPVHRGYMCTQFINLNAGKHIVEFRYETPGNGICCAISLACWVIMAAGLGITAFSLRRSKTLSAANQGEVETREMEV